MDILFRNISNNYDEVKGRTASPNLQSSRISSMFSSKSLVIYYVRMKNNNDLEDDIDMEPINNSQLLYMTPIEWDNQINIVADPNSNIIQQCILINHFALNSTITSSPPHVDENSVINIQLPYDLNRPIELDL